MNKKKQEEKDYRTYSFRISKKNDLFTYCDEMCYKAKNLYNVSHYYIRQCHSGLKKDKACRHENEKEVINLIQEVIPTLNQIRQDTYDEKVIKGKKATEPKFFEMLTEDHWFPNLLLLDGIFRQINHVDYYNLPAQTNYAVIELAIQDWKSFFVANRDYKVNPSKYTGKPKIPHYAKKDGRKPVAFSYQTCVIKQNDDGTQFIKLPKTKLTYQIGDVKLPNGKFKQARIVPNSNYYTLELIFEVSSVQVLTTKETAKNMIAIDLGVSNFATIVNNVELPPLIVKGNVLKSKNQWFNKQRARYYGILRQGKGTKEGPFYSKRLQNLDTKRHDFIKDFFHKASRQIVNYCVDNQIDTVVMGKNKGWKSDIELDKANKQNFINIPYNLFVQLLAYKAQENGILVIMTEESYTSKASFLDCDNIPTYGQVEEEPKFLGYRATRGMYKSYRHGYINADVNGSANILRKVFPNAFDGGRDSGVVTTPKTLLVA